MLRGTPCAMIAPAPSFFEHREDQAPAVASDSVVVAVVAHVRGLSGEPLDDLLARPAREQCADRVALDRAAQEKSMVPAVIGSPVERSYQPRLSQRSGLAS